MHLEALHAPFFIAFGKIGASVLIYGAKLSLITWLLTLIAFLL
jgi:hypothetical protein